MTKTRVARLLDIEWALAPLVTDPTVPEPIQRKLAAISLLVWRERSVARREEKSSAL